ncbi:two component transcriptional regulator, LytTR family [bacterium A37T11]|nr:two component transcriptional regulator, LytTR family [bacterium A37T11]
MNITCVAVDDEPLSLQLIAKYASQIPFLQLKACFDDALSAGEYLRSSLPDLLLLDINMPDINGLDLLRSLPKPPMVIFTTAYKQHAHEGFEVNAVDYLLKPFTFDRFERAISKAGSLMAYQNQINLAGQEVPFITVYSSYKLVRIPLNQIEYIEGMEDYIKIYLTEGKPVITLFSLKKILDKLPESQFLRVHRSFIVSVEKIRYLRNKKLGLTNREIQVGDSYLAMLRNILKQ